MAGACSRDSCISIELDGSGLVLSDSASARGLYLSEGREHLADLKVAVLTHDVCAIPGNADQGRCERHCLHNQVLREGQLQCKRQEPQVEHLASQQCPCHCKGPLCSRYMQRAASQRNDQPANYAICPSAEGHIGLQLELCIQQLRAWQNNHRD